jgi:hypothetical protein
MGRVGQGSDRKLHSQKRFLDVVAEETEKATGGKRTKHTGKKIKQTELSELARQAVNSFIDAEKKLFDVAGRQINFNVKAAGKAVDLVKPFSFVPLADLTREGVKSYVDASKALIDVMRKGRNGHQHEHKPKAKHRTKRLAVHVKSEAAQAAVA